MVSFPTTKHFSFARPSTIASGGVHGVRQWGGQRDRKKGTEQDAALGSDFRGEGVRSGSGRRVGRKGEDRQILVDISKHKHGQPHWTKGMVFRLRSQCAIWRFAKGCIPISPETLLYYVVFSVPPRHSTIPAPHVKSCTLPDHERRRFSIETAEAHRVNISTGWLLGRVFKLVRVE